MKLREMPLGAVDWSEVAAEIVSGSTGTATGRVRICGDVQMRVVDYGAGYVADHWCAKGHILFVVSGNLTIEHQNGARFDLRPGMTWHAGDEEYPVETGDNPRDAASFSPHRVVCERGARVFIVD